MPLLPHVETFIRQLESVKAAPLHQLPVDQGRAGFRMLQMINGTPPDLLTVEDRTIPGPASGIPIRIYRPTEGLLPILLYLHGGGWVIGDLDTHDYFCRELAMGAESLVVAVDYRLAPEHKFPAAVEDAYAALCWVSEHASELGGDPRRIAIGGESAGGNLATVACLKAKDEGGPLPICQLLLCPATDLSGVSESHHLYGQGYMLDRPDTEWFVASYLSDLAEAVHPYVAPMRAGDLSGLPPALVITAECDPLRDDGEAYAERLRQAGVEVRCTRYDGQIHGFMLLVPLDPAREALKEAVSALREVFSKGA